MTKRQIIKKNFLGLIALLIMTAGISLCLRSSPLSALPYILSQELPLSMGTFSFLMHCLYMLIQICILGRKFPPI